MTRQFTGGRVGLAVLSAVILATLTPAAKATTVVDCAPTKLRIVAQTLNTNRSTISNTFVDVAKTDTTITQGGVAASCVVVDFSAMVATAGTVALFVRATLDGVAGTPDYSQLIVDSPSFEARSTRFVFPSVAPGPHTVMMQFHSSVSGQVVHINRSVMTVSYKP